MGARYSSSPSVASIAARFGLLASLGEDEMRALKAAETSGRHICAHREIIAEGRPIKDSSILLSGWACRSRIFPDGRRQILSLILPGDLVGVCRQHNPIAATDIMAMTDVVLCSAPRPGTESGLSEAYARSAATDEFYLFRQIARLGRLSAYERMIDLLFEVHDRLAAVGLARDNVFPFPITQDALADLLGLTTVHVNRTLRSLRGDGLVELRGGRAELKDMQRLAQLVEHRPAVVAALPAVPFVAAI